MLTDNINNYWVEMVGNRVSALLRHSQDSGLGLQWWDDLIFASKGGNDCRETPETPVSSNVLCFDGDLVL